MRSRWRRKAPRSSITTATRRRRIRDRTIQHLPEDYNYNNEAERFLETGRSWLQANVENLHTSVIEELLDAMQTRGFIMEPTFVVYEANRDVARAASLPWHEDYTLPSVMDSFRPDPSHHASYFFNWTSNKEADWARAYRIWLDFVNDYKNHGGIVSVGSDAGSLFTVWGFGTIREMEMLEEAGFTPLETIHAATRERRTPGTKPAARADPARLPGGHGAREREPAREPQGPVRHRDHEGRPGPQGREREVREIHDPQRRRVRRATAAAGRAGHGGKGEDGSANAVALEHSISAQRRECSPRSFPGARGPRLRQENEYRAVILRCRRFPRTRWRLPGKEGEAEVTNIAQRVRQRKRKNVACGFQGTLSAPGSSPAS